MQWLYSLLVINAYYNKENLVYQIFTDSPLRNFSYLIKDERSEGAWFCIDPFDGEEIAHFLKEIKGHLSMILNTHEHWDHVQGNDFLKKQFNCPVYLHHQSVKTVQSATHAIKDHDFFSLGNERGLKALETPGHTDSSCTFLLEQNGKVIAFFSGDTLFNAGVGNCRDGDPEVLYQTISSTYSNICDDALVYPGHEYLENNLKFSLDRNPSNKKAQELLNQCELNDWAKDAIVTTMEKEREVNPFLRLGDKEIIDRLDGEKENQKQVFLRLRELRNHW